MIKNKKGFTLIELLIVVAIIGIIAAIAIPAFFRAFGSAERGTFAGQLEVVRSAVNAAHGDLIASGQLNVCPSLDGTLFDYGAVPDDIVLDNNTVLINESITGNADAVTSDIQGHDGGWLYLSKTIGCNVHGNSDFGIPFLDG